MSVSEVPAHETPAGAEAALERRYLRIREDAERASAPLRCLRLRARGYLDVYAASNGACRFALIAAQGALWASWYLLCAKLAGMVLAVLDVACRLPLRDRYRQFSAYIDALKAINKDVMIETYVLIYSIRELGPQFVISKSVPDHIAHDYAKAMKAEAPDEALLRELYHRHFLWEQERVVSDRLEEAFSAFQWPLMKGLCQRPWVWFSYFRAGKSMNFKTFTDPAERVEKGLIAYDRAVAYGLEKIFSLTQLRLRIFPGAAFLPL